MQDLTHPTDEALVSLVETRLAAVEVCHVLEHLDACAACEHRLDEIEPALLDYAACSASVFESLPREPWPDLRAAIDRFERTRDLRLIAPRHRGSPPLAFAALAATLLLAAVVSLRHAGEDTLRAEAFLERARVATAHPKSHLRVRTRSGSFIRPAVLFTKSEDGALRTRFEAAHYGWDEPLSPIVYVNWSRGLQHKTSKVTQIRDAGQYAIETTTPDGNLQQATLTLTATTLVPVKGRFLFADQEWVEITPIDDTGPMISAPPALAPSPHLQFAPTGPEPLATRELKVWLAVEAAYGASDRPTVIEVEPGDGIVVTLYRPPPEGLRATLESIGGVSVRAPDGTAAAPVTAAVTAGDRIIDAGQAITAQAGLLNQLSERFGPDAETRLGSAGQRQLRDLRLRHGQELSREIESLVQLLRDDHPGFAPASVEAPAAQPADLLRSATLVDQLATGLYASEPNAASWPQLATELGRLRAAAARFMEEVKR